MPPSQGALVLAVQDQHSQLHNKLNHCSPPSVCPASSTCSLESLDALDIDFSGYRMSPKQIDSVRDEVNKHIKELGNRVYDHYNQCDIDWLLDPKKPFQLERFAISAIGSRVNSIDLITRCLAWRKESKIMSLKDTSFPSEFYSMAGIFSYSYDSTGTPMLYMRVKMIKKYPDLDHHLKSFLAYQISRMDSSSNKDLFSWSILFDCTDIGIANVQLDIMKYLITVLNDYFPCGGEFLTF